MIVMDIETYISKGLHLPKPLRTREAQLYFTSFFYKVKSQESSFYFDDVSLNDLAYFTFDVYFKEMFRFGYKLSAIRLKQGFTGLPLDVIIKRLIESDYITIAQRGATVSDYERITDDLVYSTNLDKYRKEFMYLPENMRDFHFQKSLFKMLHEKHKHSAISISFVSAQIFITDYIHHYLAYSGYVLRKARNKFDFIDFDTEISNFENMLQSRPFPLS